MSDHVAYSPTVTDFKGKTPTGLDDLCVRFIINLPHEELESVERICFQVEEAQWFYEDFIRPLDPALPSLTLKAFALRIFQHCPLMSQWSHYHHITAFSEFLAYKTRVPVRGAIMLSQDMEEVVLVKGWKKGANWSFPRGKINKGEKDLDCAIREVYEETGFDVREANLVLDENSVKHIEITMREQHMRLYVFRGVPRDTHFEPRTRKEISKIEWYKLSELPTLKKNKQGEGLAVANANKFYMVAPFLHPLKKWIAQQKKLDAKAQPGVSHTQNEEYISMDDGGYVSNGFSSQPRHTGVAIPSDLPEVTSAQDASSHLKELLKIGGMNLMPAQTDIPQVAQPAEPAGVDQLKSNALLALLRQGSDNSVLQKNNLPGLVPQLPSLNEPQPSNQAPHLAPNFFPGFPQQHQHAPTSNFMQETSVQPGYNAALNTTTQGPMGAAGLPQYPPLAQQELSTSPAFQRNPQSHAHHFQNAYPAPPTSAPAPFQRTGDPQFSQQAQPSQVSGAAVPPASKLPPPKLTNHSRALLDFFKGGAAQTPQSPYAATLAIPTPAVNQPRKTSQHQDSLLDLFKGQAKAPTPSPVELSAHPVPSSGSHTPKADVQILQRKHQQPGGGKNYGANAYKAGQTSATVQGPLNIPQFEAIPKGTPKKANGSSRKNNQNRREQAQSQPLSSPITILSRPQSAKRDVSVSRSNVQASQPVSRSPATQPQAPEPVKPFQPQILRRSDKTGYEEFLTNPARPQGSNRKPSLPDSGAQRAELAPQGNFDRRPSQTSAQKDALLSLFGKTAASPSPQSATQDYQAGASNQQSFAASGLVSPLSSSLHFPLNGDSPSRRGTPFEGETAPNRIASPSNKAFLLGYLQDVAKGIK